MYLCTRKLYQVRGADYLAVDVFTHSEGGLELIKIVQQCPEAMVWLPNSLKVPCIEALIFKVALCERGLWTVRGGASWMSLGLKGCVLVRIWQFPVSFGSCLIMGEVYSAAYFY